MIYFTSDNHFSHTNILKYCNRPFNNVKEMNEVMIERWNSRVQPQDIVYHLGDLSFLNSKGLLQLKQTLNGDIRLLRGNHDRSVTAHIKQGFVVITSGYHTIEGSKFKLSHYPKKARKVWNLHGHVHCSEYNKNPVSFTGKQINVNVEFWDYFPISLDRINKIILTGEV